MKFRDWFSKNEPHNSTGPTPEKKSLRNPIADDLAPKTARIDDSHFGTDQVTPFSKERVVSYFIEEGYKFSHDDEGDIVGIWDGHPFWFLFLGKSSDFFQVRGTWNRKVTHANRNFMMHVMNDWNRDRIWPKGYIKEDPDGTESSVYAETSFDFGEGVTPKQLNYSIDYALHTALQLFTHLNAVLPPENDEQGDE